MSLQTKLRLLGFPVESIQSPDLQLWSDRRRVLDFVLRKTMGSADMAEYLKGQCAEHYSLDDEATRLFTLLGFDHATLPNVQGRGERRDRFLKSAIDVIATMEETRAIEGYEAVGFEGFMSNAGLVDSACSHMKDLVKTEMELFPPKMLRQSNEGNVEDIQTLLQVLPGRMEQLRKDLQARGVTQTDTQTALSCIHPMVGPLTPPARRISVWVKYSDNEAYSKSLSDLQTTLTGFVERSRQFSGSVYKDVRCETAGIQGIGAKAENVLTQYRRLTHVASLIKDINGRRNNIDASSKMEDIAGIKKRLARMASLIDSSSKSISRPQ